MAYMGFKTARFIHKLNEQSNRIVSVDEIEKMKMARDRNLDKINDSLHQAKSNINRVHSAEDYVKGYEKADEIVHKYENNPFLKGKMMVSKSAKQEYETALSQRQQCLNQMKGHIRGAFYQKDTHNYP